MLAGTAAELYGFDLDKLRWLNQQYMMKADPDALAPLLEPVNDPEELTQIGEWIILCASGEDLLNRVRARVDASR